MQSTGPTNTNASLVEIASSETTAQWTEEMENSLVEMKKIHQKELEEWVNYLGAKYDPKFNDVKNMILGDKPKEFSEYGLKPYTMHYRIPYKYWNEVGLLVPDDIDLSKSAPVHVYFGGGGFWTGDWTYVDWYLEAALRQAKEVGAVILAVNYPRFPLADINDINRAIADFWMWFYSSDSTVACERHVAGLKLDQKKLVLSGESAGGYAAAYSVIYPHKNLHVTTLVVRYAMLSIYLRLDHEKREAQYMGENITKEAVQKTSEDIWNYVKKIREGMKEKGLLGRSDEGVYADILERRSPPYGMCGAFISSWCDTWKRFFGSSSNNEQLPDLLTQFMEMNKNGQKTTLESAPDLFIYHGQDDINVDVEDSKTFVREWERFFSQFTDRKITCEWVAGARHGFDYVLNDDFINNFTAKITKSWLSETSSDGDK